ncbi:hypothetical protein [Thalassoglobus neptunius]|uniref:hypothetical protein n=1 Tax=Thalassoglobus neptunius TaxID=1938619 RepID=UPI0011B4E63B|nr:hypothetical protein [Thalassoglobus neptunius]
MALIVVVSCLQLLSGCLQAPSGPLGKERSDLVEIEKFAQIESGEAIDDSITVSPTEGFYALLEIRPQANLPDQLGELPLTDPGCWPFVGIVYPEGSTAQSAEAVQIPMNWMNEPSASGCIVPVMGVLTELMQTPQYAGAVQVDRGHPSGKPAAVYYAKREDPSRIPKVKLNLDPEVLSFWTFFGPTHETPGNYQFELHVYPCFRAAPGETTTIGPPVKIYAAAFQIVED